MKEHNGNSDINKSVQPENYQFKVKLWKTNMVLAQLTLLILYSFQQNIMITQMQ